MDSPRFVQDIYPSQLLYARTIRSPVANGRLVSVDCPKLPGAYTLISGQDIPGENRLEGTEIPVLATDCLSYIGEPVALLLGPDETKLDEYHRQCKVIAKEELPVFPNADVSGKTILAERDISIGDTQAAFLRAKKTVKGRYRSGIQEHWYSEPVGAAAWFETVTGAETQEKTLLVHTASQWPFHVKRSIACALGLDASLIRVEATTLGIHMDGKLVFPSLIACQAALGAWLTKKPVRLMLTREEDFFFSPKRNSAEINIASALDEKGGILGSEIELTLDLGWRGINAAEILDQTCLGSLGLYKTGNIKISGKALQSNTPPQGPFSGFGLAQGAFALERHISQIAGAFGHNPVQWRKNNLQQSNSLPAGLPIKDKPPAVQLIDRAAAISDYNRKWASYELIRQHRLKGEAETSLRGIGIALGYQGSGFLYPWADRGIYGMELTLGKDGSLEIKICTSDCESSLLKIWAQIAAEILGIDADKVRVNTGPDAQDAGPSSASRNITELTKLLKRSCTDISNKRFRDPLPIVVRKTVAPKRNSQWESVLAPPQGKMIDASGFASPACAATVVEVEIDLLEFAPRVRGIWICIDGGRILNEESARRSVKISSIQALGWASRERLEYIDGSLTREQFESYNILEPLNIPSIGIEFLQDANGEAKGIGELPFTCIPAAFLQAASQAADVEFETIPLLPRDIWEARKKRKEDGTTSST
jgi:CO/xanthine dehydrogenase Mo-binding subunit